MLLSDTAQKMESSLVRELLHYSQQEDVLSLAGGLPDEEYMPDISVLNIKDSCQYGASEGEMRLRLSVCTAMSERYIDASIDQVIITNGSQQGLDIISRLVLDSNSIILTEEPTYLAALQVFKLQGANIQGVESDDEGMSVSAMRRVIEEELPKAVYLIPNFQNPTGHCYSTDRRKEIAALLDEKNILLIEDDPYRDLCYEDVDRTPISSLLKVAPWVYMGSYSKILWPGLRVGYLVSCEALSTYVVKLKQATDLHTNRLGQNIVASYIESTDYPLHLARLKSVYKLKRDVMIKALDHYLGTTVRYNKPAGGMFIWVTLPDHISAKLIMQSALIKKVLVLPSEPFYANDSKQKDRNLRLSFARVSEKELNQAIKILADVIKNYV